MDDYIVVTTPVPNPDYDPNATWPSVNLQEEVLAFQICVLTGAGWYTPLAMEPLPYSQLGLALHIVKALNAYAEPTTEEEGS
ncbi:MAG: hypothetical protein K0R44_2 [Thermomicrobiales bacterium]|jgi:hypothetical protein|nr:hypothetical protein [Thermomicrobiales bacterium]MDF3014777.1 hypothetical protein [Thermomicrobiales bacterium]